MSLSDPEYKTWLTDLKAKIRSVQLKAAIAVNSALIEFYWELGKMIEEKHTGYGNQFLEVLSKDLKSEFPEMSGMSVRNLKYTRQFYLFYKSQIRQQPVAEFSQQPVDQLMNHPITQIPWGHNILIFSNQTISKRQISTCSKRWKIIGAAMCWPCRSNPDFTSGRAKRSRTSNIPSLRPNLSWPNKPSKILTSLTL